MKRWLVKLVVFLLLGAIVNVAVAWGACVRRSQWSSLGEELGTNELAQRLGHSDDDLDWVNFAGAGSVQRWFGVDYYHLWYGSGIAYRDIQVEAGLPLRALVGRERRRSQIYVIASESIAQTNLPIFGERYIPFKPIWPGFAINTIFYAAILWVSFTAPGSVRRWRRRRRGLCPACAYPVGVGGICTECGGPLKCP
jgi:hypothetical protein